MQETNFKKHYTELLNSIEEKLRTYIPEKNNPQGEIYRAMNYSLLAGGKRIRPVLTLAAGELLGADRDELMPFACALEMIHTYSLIHDDLPAMDNDDYRRGRLTCHKFFGEAMAILAGDALLNKAFETAAEGAKNMKDQGKGVRMIAALAASSGTEGMVGGQVIDLSTTGDDITEADLRYMYARKTGAILNVPFEMAIECAGMRGTEEAERLLRYSTITGLAFQIKDDILDVVGDVKTLGKEPGRDAADGKTTFVTLYGVEKCDEILKEMTAEAVSLAESFGEKGNFLKEMAIYLLERNI